LQRCLIPSRPVPFDTLFDLRCSRTSFISLCFVLCFSISLFLFFWLCSSLLRGFQVQNATALALLLTPSLTLSYEQCCGICEAIRGLLNSTLPSPFYVQAALFHTLRLRGIIIVLGSWLLPLWNENERRSNCRAAPQKSFPPCSPLLRYVSSDYSQPEDLLNVRDGFAAVCGCGCVCDWSWNWSWSSVLDWDWEGDWVAVSALWHWVLSVYLFSSIIKNTASGPRTKDWELGTGYWELRRYTHSNTHSIIFSSHGRSSCNFYAILCCAKLKPSVICGPGTLSIALVLHYCCCCYHCCCRCCCCLMKHSLWSSCCNFYFVCRSMNIGNVLSAVACL